MDQEHLEVAIRAARAAAVELMARRDSRVVSEKAPRDLVTDADVAAQRAIREILQGAYPGYAFVGEEQGENRPARLCPAWRCRRPAVLGRRSAGRNR